MTFLLNVDGLTRVELVMVLADLCLCDFVCTLTARCNQSDTLISTPGAVYLHDTKIAPPRRTHTCLPFFYF